MNSQPSENNPIGESANGKLALHAKHPLLAPMDGVSDSPFRIIARKHGAGILYSEFVNGIDVVAGSPLAHSKMLFTEQEHPIGIQIFDDKPERLLNAAIIVEKNYHPDFIDINFSCSDRRVISRGAGAALLAKPEVIQQMVCSLVENIHLPITAKFRLGMKPDKLNYLEISRIIEKSGAVQIAVHGRTVDQGMHGSSNWEAIRQIKQNVHIPVIGNGDVLCPSDIDKMLAETGCDAVMIGRGAIGNPWIFDHRSLSDIPQNEIKLTVLEHLELSLSKYGLEKGLFNFRKHFKQYSRAFNLSPEMLSGLLTCVDYNVFISTFEKNV